MKLAKIHRKNKHIEPVWHIQLALLAAIALQLMLDSSLTVGPKFAIAGFELLLIFMLAIIHPKDKPAVVRSRRFVAVMLIALISIANIASLMLVINHLFHSGTVNGKELILSAVGIYITNIIIFGLWYWELDSDGVQGQSTDIAPVDFLFPQMREKNQDFSRDWSPTFFDYLYISIVNATNFSPSDTVPLTHRAKFLMGLQSSISVITVALVVTRAVSILA